MSNVFDSELNPGAMHPVDKIQDSFGERLADRTASFVGSWKFILIMTGFVAIWCLVNVLGIVSFDMWPFIGLTLLLSLQASYASPLILLAGNRAYERDQIRDGLNFNHNTETLKILKAIHKDLHGLDCKCYIS